MSESLLSIMDAGQRRALENVRAAAERVWARPLHRYYTDHTVAHSERVIALLDGLTGGIMATDKCLTSDEAFVLLAAAYLHDIGMQDERFADGDLEAIRAAHNEVTAELIYRVVEDPTMAIGLGLPDDPGIVEAVALVAKAHRKVDLHSAEYDALPHGGETLRLRLLAALLRFADELDIDHRRVDLEMIKVLDLPVVSQFHWWKCHYVSGVSITDEYVRIAYRFPKDRPDYENLIVPQIETDVRTKLANLEDIFRADAVKVALGPSPVRLMRAVQSLPKEVEDYARGQEAENVAMMEHTRRSSWTDITDQIVNPGFEEGFEGWEEDSSVINSDQADSKSVDDTTEAHTGSHSRQLFLRWGGSYIRQTIRLRNPLPTQCQIRLSAYIKMPSRGTDANKQFVLLLVTRGGSPGQSDQWDHPQQDALIEWRKVTVQTEKLSYPIHSLEIHAFTTQGRGAHKGFDKPVWVDDFTIEYRSLCAKTERQEAREVWNEPRAGQPMTVDELVIEDRKDQETPAYDRPTEIATERTIILKGATLREVRAILQEHAYREQDPVMLVLFGDPGGVAGALKLMITNEKGGRIPDELHRGTLKAVSDSDGVRVEFRLGEFPNRALFWQTAADIQTYLDTALKIPKGDNEAPIE